MLPSSHADVTNGKKATLSRARCLGRWDLRNVVEPRTRVTDRVGHRPAHHGHHRHETRLGAVVGRCVEVEWHRPRRAARTAPASPSNVNFDGTADESREDRAVEVVHEHLSHQRAQTVTWVPHDDDVHHRRKHSPSLTLFCSLQQE